MITGGSIGTVSALTPLPAINMGDQKYLFIDNQLDHEYFLSSVNLDPRFTGANVWAKIGQINQTSLGYMGAGALYMPANSYVDYWLENSPLKNPYQGSRCWAISALCPSTGYISAEHMDENGSYKSAIITGEDGGVYMRASFTQNAYEYFARQTVGNTDEFALNVCFTKQEYDPKKGERCKDLPQTADSAWYVLQMKAKKIGHLTLEDTKAYSEIWVASDGTPSLAEDAEFCRYGVVTGGLPDQNEGIICKMAKYNYKGDMSQLGPGLRFFMVLDTDALGFTPLPRDMTIQAGKEAWLPYNYEGNIFSNMFVQGSGDVEVLFSKAFFKKILTFGGSTKGKGDVFTFLMKNLVAPQSGFYQFRTSMTVDILPREYSISIKPKDLNKTSIEGIIGDDRPIEFNYKVTQSAPQKADIVTAQVLGESTVKNGQKYCLFNSDDQKTQVAIPASLSFADEQGATQSEYIGCDESKKMNMTKAAWNVVPWDEQQSGFFYSTDLKLSFPMNDPVSNFSLTGEDWMGTVHAEGDVKVEAKWIGVDAGNRH